MPTEHAVTESSTDVRSQRAANRAEIAKRSAIANVIERLDVYRVLTQHHDVHESVTKEHAERIVSAVLGIAGWRL